MSVFGSQFGDEGFEDDSLQRFVDKECLDEAVVDDQELVDHELEKSEVPSDDDGEAGFSPTRKARPFGREKSNDSVLNYFHSSSLDEQMLDQYLISLADNFGGSGPIYATHIQPSSIQAQLSQTPSAPQSMQKYLQGLKINVDMATKTGAATQIGHMSSALPYFHRPLARLLTALNQNVVKAETASTFTSLERETIAMLHKDFYNSSDDFYTEFKQASDRALGVACSGGTIANVTAMWAARNSCLALRNSFEGVAKEGLLRGLQEYGYSRACIVGSHLMHYSFKKAADLLGLGEDGLVLVPTDEKYRMRVDALKEILGQLKEQNVLVIAVVAICGTTETGSIDPIHEIHRAVSPLQIHLHVDAAWGGPLIYSPEHSHKLYGIHLANSITVDGHKQLYTPLGLGVLLFQNPNTILAIRKTAQYVIRKDSPDLGKFTLEGSRPANIVYLHASLTLLGRDGLGVLLTRSCTLVKQMATRLATHPSKAFEVLHEPQSNILLYRFIPEEYRNLPSNEWTEAQVLELNRYVEAIQTRMARIVDGRPHTFTSRTMVMYRGALTSAFRIVIANPTTRWEHIEGGIQEQLQISVRVEREFRAQKIMQRVMKMYPDQERLPTTLLPPAVLSPNAEVVSRHAQLVANTAQALIDISSTRMLDKLTNEDILAREQEYAGMVAQLPPDFASHVWSKVREGLKQREEKRQAIIALSPSHSFPALEVDDEPIVVSF
ncbi:hypothetical protein HDV03_003962 [Kappamyces sp. JEL0829]|nr:hypothetical protein HDV03_003962 [Kappamyces sp. JEL0829]